MPSPGSALAIVDKTNPDYQNLTQVVKLTRKLLQVDSGGRDPRLDESSQGSLLGGNGQDVTKSYPWIYTPEGFKPFDYMASIATPAIGGGDTTVLSFQVPNGYNGIISKYSLNYSGGGFVEGSGALIWRILRDGAAIEGFDSINTSRGTPATPRELDTGIQIRSNQIISVVVNNVAQAGGGTFCIASLVGRVWPARTN